MIVSFITGQATGLAIGFVAGAFTPSIGRKIKSFWVKETQSGIKAVEAKAQAVSTTVKTDVSKVASKL